MTISINSILTLVKSLNCSLLHQLSSTELLDAIQIVWLVRRLIMKFNRMLNAFMNQESNSLTTHMELRLEQMINVPPIKTAWQSINSLMIDHCTSSSWQSSSNKQLFVLSYPHRSNILPESENVGSVLGANLILDRKLKRHNNSRRPT